MKTPIPKITRSLLLAAVILAACLSRAAEPDQILFLHLKLKDDVITCVGSSVRLGHLKTPASSEKRGTLYLELVSTNGAPIWTEVLAEPTVRRLEYEDPDHPGALKHKEISFAETEFTVRVPFQRGAHQLKVHRLDRPSNREDAPMSGRSKKLLGSIVIPVKETTP